ncbi:hypothetical protein Zm00014a_028437 [Zea mays]|uniref:Uncharacterized protein n=2 Tax=Zea mays TaxID=4577 RepID=A0A317YHD5_MAIZE|nr:hypothetical protein Zm00014a_028437 [Zea mays]PWZ58108.1 hypothetical protein Zm00014a_028437 [Zea mays]
MSFSPEFVAISPKSARDGVAAFLADSTFLEHKNPPQPLAPFNSSLLSHAPSTLRLPLALLQECSGRASEDHVRRERITGTPSVETRQRVWELRRLPWVVFDAVPESMANPVAGNFSPSRSDTMMPPCIVAGLVRPSISGYVFEEIVIESKTVRLSRWPFTRLFADPARFCREKSSTEKGISPPLAGVAMSDD